MNIYISYFLFIALGLIATIMAIEDWKYSEINGAICYIGWLSVIITCAFHNKSLTISIIVLILFILYIVPFEIPYFGDADFIPVASYLSFFVIPDAFYHFYGALPTIPLAILLLILYPYAVLYYRNKGSKYKLFSGQPIPLLPVFAVMWWCSSPLLYLIKIWE